VPVIGDPFIRHMEQKVSRTGLSKCSKRQKSLRVTICTGCASRSGLYSSLAIAVSVVVIGDTASGAAML
jgi:hypothetical protein